MTDVICLLCNQTIKKDEDVLISTPEGADTPNVVHQTCFWEEPF